VSTTVNGNPLGIVALRLHDPSMCEGCGRPGLMWRVSVEAVRAGRRTTIDLCERCVSSGTGHGGFAGSRCRTAMRDQRCRVAWDRLPRPLALFEPIRIGVDVGAGDHDSLTPERPFPR
jgi:hypothetical protein